MNEKIFKIAFFLIIICIGLYFTYPTELTQAQKISYLKSYGITLVLTSGGFILAFLRFLGIKPIRLIIDEYVDMIRGTPIVIQLMVFVFIIFATWSNNIAAAIFALGLNSSAYVAEIVRSGINSVDRGQMEAARAMGLGYGTAMKEIVFPQAIKNILPALANEFISLFKETSVVGLVAITDLTFFSKSMQAALYTVQPILFAAVLYYASVKFFSFLVKMLESRLNRND